MASYTKANFIGWICFIIINRVGKLGLVRYSPSAPASTPVRKFFCGPLPPWRGPTSSPALPAAERRGRDVPLGRREPRGRGGSSVPSGAGARKIFPARKIGHVPATSQLSVFPGNPHYWVPPSPFQVHHDCGCVGDSQSHRVTGMTRESARNDTILLLPAQVQCVPCRSQSSERFTVVAVTAKA